MDAEGSAQATIEALIAAGKPIAAAVRFSDATGASFHDAREAVDRFVRGGAWLAWHREALRAGSWHRAIAEAGALAPDPQSVVEALIREGAVNQAIQRLAELSSMGVFEAKRAVDQYASLGFWLPHDLARIDQGGTASEPRGPGLDLPEGSGEAITWLFSQLRADDPRRAPEIEWVVAVDVTGFPGFLIMLRDRGEVVYRDGARWRRGPGVALRDITEVALHDGAFGLELHLEAGFVRERISLRSPAGAAELVELMEARARRSGAARRP
ncbi:MAG: hypothetical protein KC636_04550 [Myxococcales bacterium]|nr:hypothetical protein [Myxococcales bacterium]